MLSEIGEFEINSSINSPDYVYNFENTNKDEKTKEEYQMIYNENQV